MMQNRELPPSIVDRPVYLWGARQNGLSMCRVLERRGITPRGFVDSSRSLQGNAVFGYPVHPPEEVLVSAPRPFILISSGFFSDDIAEQCERAGFQREQDYISFAELQRFDYQVDVAGRCNLRCISCPRGNMTPQPESGMMSVATYAKVLDKILREDPYVGAVSLYNWGEPLLNRDLAAIVHATNDRGVHAAISSNLNIRFDFSDVIRARPTWFRVSVSGYGENYEVTHTGGKWALFESNLHRLRKWRDAFHPEMFVEVFYHIYEHSKEDLPKVRDLCEELGFTFRYRHAALAPLENVEAYIENRPLSAAARQTTQLQALSVGEAMEIARQQRDRNCFYERCLWIRWDLTIGQCMEWFDAERTLVPGDFLSTPLDEIIAARKDNEFCQSCKDRSIHRCYIVYGDERLVHQRKRISV